MDSYTSCTASSKDLSPGFPLHMTYDLTIEIIMEWIIACDQPFKEVKRPIFVVMMNYAHHTGTLLKIPKCKSIKWHLMKMGSKTVEDVHRMFLVWSYLSGRECIGNCIVSDTAVHILYTTCMIR